MNIYIFNKEVNLQSVPAVDTHTREGSIDRSGARTMEDVANIGGHARM